MTIINLKSFMVPLFLILILSMAACLRVTENNDKSAENNEIMTYNDTNEDYVKTSSEGIKEDYTKTDDILETDRLNDIIEEESLSNNGDEKENETTKISNYTNNTTSDNIEINDTNITEDDIDDYTEDVSYDNENNNEDNNEDYNEELANEPNEPIISSDSIINTYGSYENFRKAIIDEVNNIRIANGVPTLEDNYYLNDITNRVGSITVNSSDIGHPLPSDYPELIGVPRGLEAIGYANKREFNDAAYVASSLTTYHTKKIADYYDLKYIGVSIMETPNSVCRNGIQVVIEACSQTDMDLITGTNPAGWDIIINGEPVRVHSIYAN